MEKRFCKNHTTEQKQPHCWLQGPGFARYISLVSCVERQVWARQCLVYSYDILQKVNLDSAFFLKEKEKPYSRQRVENNDALLTQVRSDKNILGEIIAHRSYFY